ncbi:hypothetical protein C8Q78DRAFT_1129698 [Trametes maxima]|nr:hypothetical protein C8Q78DRAFT_1129698 [Trametes maxima]
MSRAHQELLKRLCHNRDTLERAKAVLHTASIKTVQGSGYELGQGSSGLPAICAYLAAEELGDNDVTEQIAQAASCLKPRVFKTTLNTVKGALSASASAATPSPSKSSRNVTYLALLSEKKIGRKGMVQEWMQGVERTLMANRETRRKFGAAYDAITIAVFCWTGQVMGANKLGAETLLDNYSVSQDTFDEITQALDELCQDAAKQVQSAIASLKAGASPTKSKATTSPSKTAAVSPTKPKPPAPTLPPALVPPTPSRAAALTRSPSKSALRAPSVDLSPRKTPSHKRKVAFDGPLAEEDEDAFDALATPSKRQKFSSPVVNELQLTSAGTPRKSSRLARADGSSVASSSRETLDLLRHAASGIASVPSTPRRSRAGTGTGTGTVSQPSSAHSTRSARSQPRTPTRRKPALPTVAEEHVPRRRYRPAFADTQQWLKGDVRLERTLKPWAERWRELVGSCEGDVWAAARVAGQGGTVRVGS